MSSSSWYRMAGEQRNKARRYEKLKKELEKIVPLFSNSFGSIISDIGRNTEKAEEEAKRGLRKNSAAEGNADVLSDGREADAESDSKMSASCSCINAEINELERKRQEAERLADEYQRRGDEEKERERQERLEMIQAALAKA